eukprot:Skav236478  [mRNA]  locus=scaffold1440:95236:97566:+ [translate_table: standard]
MLAHRFESDFFGCRLVLPQDAAELNQPKASDVLEPLEGGGQDEGGEGDEDEDRTCCICLDENADSKLPCGHKYHASCLESWFEQRPTCPTCGQFFGDRMGSMPDGSMAWNWSRAPLAGHRCATIILHFNFRSGISPEGQNYEGRSQHAYLPDNDEGRKLLAMFQLAFRRRVLFSLTQSLTTQLWQPTFAIHLKTSMSGGPAMHGYPDDQYFDSATEELRLAGIDLDAALPVAIGLRRSSHNLARFRRDCFLRCRVMLQAVWPGAHLAVLTMSNDGRILMYAFLGLFLAILLPPKPLTCVLLVCFMVSVAASTPAPLAPCLPIAIVAGTVMVLALLFALGHLWSRTQSCFGRFRIRCIRAFLPPVRVFVAASMLALARAWRVGTFGIALIIFDCGLFLLLLLRLGALRCCRTPRARLVSDVALLSDMQQALIQAEERNLPEDRAEGVQLGPIRNDSWATYASTPSLQGRADMRTIHGRFLQSLEPQARDRASTMVHEMLANERRFSEDYVVLYHLYSYSGLLYEIQTALAVELLEYPIDAPPVMRLSRRAFAELGSLLNLLRIRERNLSDRADEYRSLAVSAFSSCFASGGYGGSMQQFLWEGFPSGASDHVNKQIEDLISSAGITNDRNLLSSLASRIRDVGNTHGLGTGPKGQVLQIFVHKSVVNAFAYGAQPLGALAPRGIPLTEWLQQQCPLEGQVRLVPHPDLFLAANEANVAGHRGLVKIFDFCPSRDIDKLTLRHELQVLLRPHLIPARARHLLGYDSTEDAEFPIAESV